MQGPLILDRYRPIETKGEGGSGTVTLCWDTRIQRRVAIKRLPISSQGSTGEIPGLAEARTGAMLNHPSIVSVIDFETEGNEALLIMEAIEGPSLAGLLDDTEPATFDLDEIASVARAISDALEFAHENQVLHLDIKPDNILITQGGIAKVSDFGISELADVQGFKQACGGTIGYMPPEQMRAETLDQRCDEFAFAVVVYEMLTGQNPFLATSLEESIEAIERPGFPLPSELRDDVNPDIDNVLLCGMACAREQRYDTVYEFMEALAPYLGDPAKGQVKLRAYIAAEDELDRETETAPEGRHALSLPSPRTQKVLSRLIAALISWWVAALGLNSITQLATPAALACALLPAIAAAIKPPLGALLAMGILGACMIYTPGTSTILGIVVIVAATAWLAVSGREGTADASCTLCVAPLGLVWLAPLAPFITGYCLPLRRAASSAVMSAVLALCLCCASGSDSLLHFNLALASDDAADASFMKMLQVPSTWIQIAAWVLSAFFMSVLCARKTRVLSVLATLFAAITLLAAQIAIGQLESGTVQAPALPWMASIGIACAIMIIVSVYVTPLRDIEED